KFRKIVPQTGAPEIVEANENFMVHYAVDSGYDSACGFERLGGLCDDVANLAFECLAGAGIEHQADAQLANILVQTLPVDVVGRQAHTIATIGPRQHAHHHRGVVDRASHGAGDTADI